jgi:outer membrane beta-barrel protein
MKEAMMRRFITVSAILLGVLGASGRATAQEIQLTGPLAGAPAVRQLRLHRAGRFEVAPTVSFTLLDEYQRTILVGGRLTYNLTEWLGIGAWGAFGAVKTPTGLSQRIQEVTQLRRGTGPAGEPAGSINNLLTAASIGPDFKQQLGTINWVVAPQVTFIPFRGKLAIFQKIFVDTDAYLFAGPAFVGLKERADCTDCVGQFNTATRMQIAPTFGLGLTFYMGGWASLGLEYRALPYAWNTGGFDTRGGAPDGRFPDNKISKEDREFKFNQMLSVNVGIYLPTSPKHSP